MKKKQNIPNFTNMTRHNANISALTECFADVLKTVTARLQRKYGYSDHSDAERCWRLDHRLCENFAQEGIEYAVRLYLRADAKAVLSEGNLTGLATWKAKNLALDWLKRTNRRPDLLLLDAAAQAVDDDMPCAENQRLMHAEYDNWRYAECDRCWKELGRHAYEHLEELFDLLNLSTLRREVFRAVYLEAQPVVEVCERYGIKSNYAYGIVFGVRKGLAEIGPAFLRDAA